MHCGSMFRCRESGLEMVSLSIESHCTQFPNIEGRTRSDPAKQRLFASAWSNTADIRLGPSNVQRDERTRAVPPEMTMLDSDVERDLWMVAMW